VITEALAGQRIAVTGATGFLGTALVERLLRSVPDTRLVLLVRPGRRSSAARRVEREILRNDAFDRLRAELGDYFDAVMATRIEVVSGDVAIDGLGLDDAGRAAFAACDTVIHSAATVSFDSPLDASVEINLVGPNRILEVLQAAGATPHLIAVSTCYVAGSRRGLAPEEFLDASPFHIDIDWRAEVDAARRARADLDATSRSPAHLRRFGREARRELGPAGLPMLSAKTEQLRRAWVNDEMVAAGTSRARSLGWPDVYTYSKALGERALVELHGDVPVTVVRPSIIESAWAEPFPGWIRGFRMVEPLIVSYAKGELHQFPGYPEGIIDVIPVDMVTAALCAVAAAGPPAEPAVYQVASGDVQPLRYSLLTETIQRWFHDHPIYDATGQPVSAANFEYTGTSGLEQRLERARKLLDYAGRAANALPVRGRRAAIVERVAERRELVDQALGYVQLYGHYGKCEARYSIDHLMELWARLDDDDRARFGFDPTVIDWLHYITEIHLPTVIQQGRLRTTPGARRGPARETRLRAAVLHPDRQFAAFDLENTLIASNVVESYAWLATRRLNPRERLRFAVRTVAQTPGLWMRDRVDRSDFLRFFYRRYEGAPIDQLDADALEMFRQMILTKAFPSGLRRVREHRRAGHRTVLITGALDIVTAPLAPLFDDVIAASMTRRDDGTWSGELVGVPPTGEVRAQVMLAWAGAHGFDPAQGVAYADAASDLPLFEAVGYPVVVNPEPRLITIAEKRGWLTEDWHTSPGSPKPLLPMAPPTPKELVV
jgi:HAD superfamily hydrolase (TIGR01490 family)